MNFSWDFILAIEKCTVYYVVSIYGSAQLNRNTLLPSLS